MFEGFSPEAADLLWNLRFNNDKEWFNPRQAEFQRLVQAPFKALANEVWAAMDQQHPELHLNLHISRIYRDARRLFGRGPMKDHLWFSLFCAADKDEAVPSLFFSFEPEGFYYGVGCGSKNMPKYRAAILKDPEALLPLARAFAQQDKFVMDGECYARSKGDVGPVLQPWFDHKRLSLCCHGSHGEGDETASLKDEILAGFHFLLPYYRYWLKIAQAAE